MKSAIKEELPYEYYYGHNRASKLKIKKHIILWQDFLVLGVLFFLLYFCSLVLPASFPIYFYQKKRQQSPQL